MIEAIEGHDLSLVAGTLVILAESHVGIAGHKCEHESPQQIQEMRIAETYIERARVGMYSFDRLQCDPSDLR